MREQLHASCVDVDGLGILVTGESGSGKSSLCAQLLVQGARLVADDQVIVDAKDGGLYASCPGTIGGLIELYPFGVVAVAGPVMSTRLVVCYHCVTGVAIERAAEPSLLALCGLGIPKWDVNAASMPLSAQILLHIQGLKQV